MSHKAHADQWLRAMRAKHDLTQQELADKTGLTLRDIQRIEHGDLHMSYKKYLAVADYFHVMLDEMLYGEVEDV